MNKDHKGNGNSEAYYLLVIGEVPASRGNTRRMTDAVCRERGGTQGTYLYQGQGLRADW